MRVNIYSQEIANEVQVTEKESKLGRNGEGVHGMSPIGVSARMLGLHNSTVRDVLILNGDIR